MKKTFENITYARDLKTSLLESLDEISSILIDHSGPFATNAIIGSKYRQVNDVDTMTKDGIQILSHLLVSTKPGTRFATRNARFVGIAVDNRSHDGTTTSMLTFCGLARVALQYMDTDVYDSARWRWVEELKDVLDYCKAFLQTLLITDEDILNRCSEMGIETDDVEVRTALAYHMAMISSKGDHNLSEKVAQIIRSSPKKIYGMYRNSPLAVETTEPYTLKRQEYDLGIRGNIGSTEDYNHRNNTQFLTENAVIFATHNDISINSMESMFLNAFISDDPRVRSDLGVFGVDKGWEHYHEGTRQLVILSPVIADPKVMEHIKMFNIANPKNRIVWFNCQVAPRLRTSFNKTLHFMAGASMFEDVMTDNALLSLIGMGDRPAKVEAIGSSVAISNLYQRDGGVFHPYYNNPEAFPPYTEFCRETEEIIELALSNITNPILDQDEVTMLTSFYRALTSQTILEIEVGGLKHEQYANQTVYEDAMGAALSAVEDGVILGGYIHLAQHLRPSGETFMDIVTKKQSKIKEFWSCLKLVAGLLTNPTRVLNFVKFSAEEQFADVFEEVVRNSLRMTDNEISREILRRPLADKWSYIVASQASYRHSDDPRNYVLHRSLDKEQLVAFLKMEPGSPVLVQAFGGYHEQFKRFRDMIPLIANSTHLVDMRKEQDGDLA